MSNSQNESDNRRWYSRIGPALILATVVVGPGSLTLHTIAGASFRYQLLWVPVVGTLFMIAYTHTAARISLVTRRTLFDLTRETYGQGMSIVAGGLAFLAVLAFQAGNTAAVGFASQAYFAGDIRAWAAAWTIAAIALTCLPRLYGRIEWAVKWMVGAMLLTFIGTLLVVGVDAPNAIQGLVPTLPDASVAFLAVGMIGTTFSIVAAVYQSYLITEKGWSIEQKDSPTVDCVVGIGVLGLISCVILMTSAAVIHDNDTKVNSVQEMAMQLEPLVGPSAFYLFTIGFFLASFSSLVVNPLIGATLLSDSIGRSSRMNDRFVRGVSIAGLVMGLIVVCWFDGSPTELIRVAQGMAVIAFPLLGFLTIDLSRRRSVMSEWTTKPWMMVVLCLGFAILLLIVANYLKIIMGF